MSLLFFSSFLLQAPVPFRLVPSHGETWSSCLYHLHGVAQPQPSAIHPPGLRRRPFWNVEPNSASLASSSEQGPPWTVSAEVLRNKWHCICVYVVYVLLASAVHVARNSPRYSGVTNLLVRLYAYQPASQPTVGIRRPGAANRETLHTAEPSSATPAASSLYHGVLFCHVFVQAMRCMQQDSCLIWVLLPGLRRLRVTD